MDDMQLLELAAKAAGIKAQYSENMGDFSIGEPYSHGERRWNPLTDDGDALWLAVRLHITPNAGETKCSATWWIRPDLIEQDSVVEPTNTDAYAATRRAIVRAAAAIASREAGKGE